MCKMTSGQSGDLVTHTKPAKHSNNLIKEMMTGLDPDGNAKIIAGHDLITSIVPEDSSINDDMVPNYNLNTDIMVLKDCSETDIMHGSNSDMDNGQIPGGHMETDVPVNSEVVVDHADILRTQYKTKPDKNISIPEGDLETTEDVGMRGVIVVNPNADTLAENYLEGYTISEDGTSNDKMSHEDDVKFTLSEIDSQQTENYLNTSMPPEAVEKMSEVASNESEKYIMLKSDGKESQMSGNILKSDKKTWNVLVSSKESIGHQKSDIKSENDQNVDRNSMDAAKKSVREKHHECKICGKAFFKLKTLRKHRKTHAKLKPNQCSECKREFKTISIMKKHMVLHSGVKPYKCELCSKTFARGTTLKSHMLTHTGEKPHICETCGQAFAHLVSLKAHLTKHTGVLPYQCTECFKEFNRSNSLKTHMLTHTGAKPYECRVCKQLFAHSVSLDAHMSSHTGIKPYKCEVCHRAFNRSSTLTKHMMTHTGLRPHQCELCGKAFTQISNLKAHMLTHTGIKPYNCEVCNKTFSQGSSLKKHMYKHNGKAPHRCMQCDKAFVQANNLRSHMLSHAGIKMYHCDVCEKGFTRSNNLKAHMAKHDLTSSQERVIICDSESMLPLNVILVNSS